MSNDPTIPDDDLGDEILEEIEESAAAATASAEETDKAAADNTRRLPPAQWAEIVSLWEHGKASAREISEKYKISKTAIFGYFKRNGIVWQSKIDENAAAADAASAAASAAAVSDFVAQRQARIDETKESHYNYQRVLDQLLMKRVVESMKPDPLTRIVPGLETVAGDIKVLRQAKTALAIGRRERFLVLGAENEIDDRELSNLVIEEKTDEEIRKIASIQDELDEDEIVADGDKISKAP